MCTWTCFCFPACLEYGPHLPIDGLLARKPTENSCFMSASPHTANVLNQGAAPGTEADVCGRWPSQHGPRASAVGGAGVHSWAGSRRPQGSGRENSGLRPASKQRSAEVI